jgi:hypothetical protein
MVDVSVDANICSPLLEFTLSKSSVITATLQDQNTIILRYINLYTLFSKDQCKPRPGFAS